jgi:hypothetical protein
MSNYDHDYYYEDRRNSNSFIMLPAGLIVGFALGPLYFSHPHIFVQGKDWLQEMILSFIPDYPEYVTYIMIGLLVLVLFLLRGILRKYWMLAGLALGVALWIPFGAHAMHFIPQVKTYFPQAEPELTLIVAGNEQFTAARNWAVKTIPLPPEAVPSLSDALAAEKAAETAETPN